MAVGGGRVRGSAIASAAHHDDVMDRRKNNTLEKLLKCHNLTVWAVLMTNVRYSTVQLPKSKIEISKSVHFHMK